MKKRLVLLFMVLVNCYVFAQNTVTVTGKITESITGDPVIGASVIIKGTRLGTAADLDGNFTLSDVPVDAVLQVSSLGMKTVEIPVNNRTKIDVRLEEDAQLMDEVVVVGYGSMKVKDLTSSITTVRSDEMLKTPAGQAMQALQGKVAGMQVVSSGAPGNQPTVKIRGIGSFPGSGSDGNPLYVVDGVFYDNIDFLNMSDIATVSVLKDASAAAIYGVRAANGVILIETKSGAYDKKTEISFDGYYGFQRAQNILKMANAEQFVTFVNESGSSSDISFIQNAMQRFGRSRTNPNIPDVNTNWYDEILRVAAIQNYAFDVSGGSNKASYSIGTSYFVQEGILDMKNEYNRFNLRSKLDFKATDWLTVGGNMIWSQGTKYAEEIGAWNQAYFAVPILPVYDESNEAATPTKYANAKYLGYRGSQNPFPTLDNSDKRSLIKKLLANFYLTVDLIPKKLNFKTSYNNAYTNIEERNVYFPYALGEGISREKSSINKYFKNYSNVNWDNLLTYTDTFGDHAFTLMGGTSYRVENYSMLQAKGVDFPYKHEESWYIDQSNEVPVLEGSDKQVKDDGLKQYGMSYFGRLSYSYMSKYMLYGTIRADGSSKYQEKWGYFPAVGAGWVISEEGFLKDNTFVDYLKLRGSWGKLGNDKINASDGSRTAEVASGAFNDVLLSGAAVSGVFSYLGWENTVETNVGISTKFLGNRLGIEADYYTRDTENAAIGVKIPAVGGTVLKNVGIVRNSGLELAADWNDKINSNWSYSVSANISTLKNEVRDLYGQPYIDSGSAEFRQRSIVGQPLLSFFGYEVAGVYQNQAEVDADPIAKANSLVPGDLKFKDANGDGILNDDDRVVLGSYFPTLMYGGNLGVTFKNIDLSANFYGQSGNKILNRKRGEYIWTNDTNIDADIAVNRWHGEGTSDKYPSSAGMRKGWNQKMSTFYVEDGAFFRIQNIQIAYNVKDQRWFGAQMPDMRISLTADRPLTLFKYNGFNPEIPDGVDTQTYPVPAVYTVGLNIKF